MSILSWYFFFHQIDDDRDPARLMMSADRREFPYHRTPPALTVLPQRHAHILKVHRHRRIMAYVLHVCDSLPTFHLSFIFIIFFGERFCSLPRWIIALNDYKVDSINPPFAASNHIIYVHNNPVENAGLHIKRAPNLYNFYSPRKKINTVPVTCAQNN
mgnify:CR=1 FL=1